MHSWRSGPVRQASHTLRAGVPCRAVQCPEMSADWKRTTLTFSTAVGVTALIYKWYQARVAWSEVGQIDSIKLYPIKSAAPFSVISASCGERGLVWQSETVAIHDRMFVVFEEVSKSVVTSRTYPELLKVQTSPGPGDGCLLFHHHSATQPHSLRLLTVESGPTITIGMKFPTTEVEELSVYDCGDEVAVWISAAIHCPQARLGYWPQGALRDISRSRARELPVYKHLHNKYTGAFSNLSSYLLLNKSSVDDLKKRLGDRGTVYEENFRANLTVRGAEPYAEDDWARIQVGDTTRLRIVKNCVRCVLVTLNPVTLEKDPHLEPLKTLKTYRQLKEPREREIEGDSPVMGCYVGLEHPGDIKVGDKVLISLQH